MTIKDLAKETGYSVGTISRVLNGQPNVSERAKQTILAYVEKSGFQLNANAKQLRQTHGDGILAVVTGRQNELFAHMIEHIQRLLAETQYPLTVDYVDESDDAVQHALRPPFHPRRGLHPPDNAQVRVPRQRVGLPVCRTACELEKMIAKAQEDR